MREDEIGMVGLVGQGDADHAARSRTGAARESSKLADAFVVHRSAGNRAGSRLPSPQVALVLQRSVGNRAVSRLALGRRILARDPKDDKSPPGWVKPGADAVRPLRVMQLKQSQLGEATPDPRLAEEAMKYRIAKTSLDPDSFKLNVAVIKYRRSGRIYYKAEANLPGTPMHSEGVLLKWLLKKDGQWQKTEILEVFTERRPCVNCGSLLDEAVAQMKRLRSARGQSFRDFRTYYAVETSNDDASRAEELQEKYLGAARAQADREAFAAMRATKRSRKAGKGEPPEAPGGKPPSKAPGTGDEQPSTATTEQEETTARTTAKFVAESQARLARWNKLFDRLQLYWKLYGALQHVLTLLSAIDNMEKLLEHGTAMPKEQAQADAILKASQDAKEEAETETDDISLFEWTVMIGEAARRKDSKTVFELDSSLIGLHVALDKAARGYEELSAALAQQLKPLMDARLEQLIRIVMPDASGTANNAIAFALYVSLEKLQGTITSASRIYSEAAEVLRQESTQLEGIEKLANDMGWDISQAKARVEVDVSSASASSTTSANAIVNGISSRSS